MIIGIKGFRLVDGRLIVAHKEDMIPGGNISSLKIFQQGSITPKGLSGQFGIASSDVNGDTILVVTNVVPTKSLAISC